MTDTPARPSKTNLSSQRRHGRQARGGLLRRDVLPMPADADQAWDMCDVYGDLLVYCPEWRRRYPEAVERQAREPRGW